MTTTPESRESVEQLARRIKHRIFEGREMAFIYDVASVIGEWLRSHGIDPATMKPVATQEACGETAKEPEQEIAVQCWKMELVDMPPITLSTGGPKLYERFTDRARKVMQLANQEAQRFNHEYISPGHIVIALVNERSGLGGQALIELGVDMKKARLALEKIEKHGPDMVTIGKLPQTPRAKLVIETAIAEAKALLHDYVGTEHIALALAAVVEGPHVEMFKALGVEQVKLRETVLRYFKETEDAVRKQLQPAQPTPQSEVSVVERDRGLVQKLTTYSEMNDWSDESLARIIADHMATERAEAERVKADALQFSEACGVEKKRRVYYQSIVYDVCNKLDKVFAGKVACGTIEKPSTEVQERVDQLLEKQLGAIDLVRADLRRERDDLCTQLAATEAKLRELELRSAIQESVLTDMRTDFADWMDRKFRAAEREINP